MQTRSGFTLIEISIVLIIIGLIVGGVLVGRDLIEAAKIRAQITQIERFTTAVQTFRTKYNSLPGDLNSTDATAFGFTPRGGTIGHGNGDGILEYCDGTVSAAPNLGCEYVLFWHDLSDAGLIEGAYTAATDTPVTIAAGQTNNLYIPDAKIGNNNSVAVFSISTAQLVSSNLTDETGTLEGLVSCGVGSVCYAILNLTNITNGVINEGLPKGGVTPAEAFAIDSKIDDGLPMTGNVYGGSPEPEFMEVYDFVDTPPPDPVLLIPGFDPFHSYSGQCLTATVSPSDPDKLFIFYNTTADFYGTPPSPDAPSCMLNISGQ